VRHATLPLAGAVLAIWLSYRLEPGDRTLFTLMGLYALVAIGLSLLMGFAGQISLGQGAFYALGAYAAGILAVGLDPDDRLVDPQAGISPALAVVVAPLVTAAVAAVIGVPLLRLRGHYLAFATLALHLILLAAIFAQDRFTGGQDPGLVVVKPLEILGWQVTGVTGSSPRHTALVWGTVAVTLLLALNLVRSRPGRALQAIASSERAAAAAGIDVASYKLRLFVLSAGLAGLAGALYVFLLQFLSPDAFGIFLSVQFVVMVAVGGLGSVYGAVAGAIVVTWLQDRLQHLGTRDELLGQQLPDQAPQVFSIGVFGLLLLAVILLFPRGLLPALGDGVRRARGRQAAGGRPSG
jgi:branched-chain amino acid transport system permease protein